MGRKCCVPKCSSNYDAALRMGQSTISTFKFPEDKHLRDRWVRALKRDNDWQPGRTASICINHFQPEDIMRYDKPAKLKPEAVPSIFENLPNKGPIVKRGRPRKSEIQEESSDGACEEYLEPVDGLLDELILDFDSFSKQISEKFCLEGWHHYQSDNVMHFYNIYEQDADTAIRIDNSIKVFEDMKMKLFLVDIRQSDENLNWILGHDMKICRWSQFETILQKYDSKIHHLKKIVQTHQDERSVIHSEEQGKENESPSPNVDSSVEYLDQQEGEEEIEFLTVNLENEQDIAINSVRSVRNPLRTNKERVIMAQERAERKNIKDIVRKLKNAKHKCFICEQEHESNEDFERHLLEHTGMLPFSCEQCVSQSVTVKTLASLNKHFLMHLKPLKCRSCDVRFSNYSTRLLHEQNSHENSGPFTCEVCAKISHSLRGHQHHFKVHTNPESMKCQLCGKQLSSGYELKLHMRVHTKEKPNKCPFCPASFNRISNLVVHKRRLHGTERPYRCAPCGEEFRSNVELKRHATSHDSDTLTISKEKPIRKVATASSCDGKKDYYCKACDKLMPNASSYHSHMRKHRKRYQCSFCGLRVGQLRDFIDHENTHTGRRPYECDVCLKTFKTSSTYYGHRAVHAAEKRFSCEVCGRRFNRLRHMVVHARTHATMSLQKSYTCSICSETFADRNAHRKHVESHNAVQYVENQSNPAQNSHQRVATLAGESEQVTVTLATPMLEPHLLPRIIHTADGKEAILVTADMISSQNFIILQQSAKENTDI